jgi:hypothetical protein
LVVVAVVLAAGVVLLVRAWDSGQATPVPASERKVQTAVITHPLMGATGQREVEFAGTVTELQPGETLWIVLKEPGGRRYYPAVGPCSVEGDEWTCPAVEFDELPGAYQAFPVMADAEGTPGMVALVPGQATSKTIKPVDRLPRGTWQWGPEVLFATR